ncbi:MAG: FAD-binding oxidoreductase [Anaerolineae bacterium]|nr:FAD-binding oxidoreductase [Anaerolineae bacterium]
MVTQTYDAVIIGAGYIGCAVAYHLTAAGLRTALLDRGGVAAGASQANYGNVQVQDAELGHSLPMVTAGYARFRELEEELGSSISYRRLGSLLLIETETQWKTMAARLPALQAAGINAELVPAGCLPELEPLLDPGSVLGACYHPSEGQVYPFALIWAYLRRGQALGLALHTHTEVIGFEVIGGQLQGIRTNRGNLSTKVVVLATGAWTSRLGQTLGRTWDIPFVHGQAIVTERVERRLNNHIASAAFFEDIHEEADPSNSVSAVLAISQATHGNFLLGEVGLVTDNLNSEATPGGQAAIAKLVSQYFPAMRRLRILRGWAAPVAFTGDNLPFLGPVDGIQGLILATAFKSTVIVTPLVGETIAQLVVEGRTELDLTPFSPNRTIDGGQ